MQEKSQGIKTTADLRKFLANAMLGVRDGSLNIHQASQITKLAAQINESIYAEIKTTAVMAVMGKESAQLGELALGEAVVMKALPKKTLPA